MCLIYNLFETKFVSLKSDIIYCLPYVHTLRSILVEVSMFPIPASSKTSLRHECAPSSFCWGDRGEGWASNQIFKKKGGGSLTGSQFDILILRGFIFFRRGCSFDIKNKLKSEIFNDKKVYKRKCFFLSWL